MNVRKNFSLISFVLTLIAFFTFFLNYSYYPAMKYSTFWIEPGLFWFFTLPLLVAGFVLNIVALRQMRKSKDKISFWFSMGVFALYAILIIIHFTIAGIYINNYKEVALG